MRGIEGVEGVFDEGLDSFTVVYPQPSVTMVKSSVLLTSPVPGNLKRIPQAVVRYDITVTNSGPGAVDANTLVITDPIPANSVMYVATTPANPVVFVNGSGSAASGLTFNYATNVQYSSTRRQRALELHPGARCERLRCRGARRAHPARRHHERRRGGQSHLHHAVPGPDQLDNAPAAPDRSEIGPGAPSWNSIQRLRAAVSRI